MARTDTERLDWLADSEISLYDRDGNSAWEWYPVDAHDVEFRAAIDKAMDAQQTRGEAKP